MRATACHATDVYGVSYAAPDVATMREVLDTLDEADAVEHPDVSLVHDSGWALTVTAVGHILWENLKEPEEARPIRVLRHAGRERGLALWQNLAAGELAAVEAEPWQRMDD